MLRRCMLTISLAVPAAACAAPVDSTPAPEPMPVAPEPAPVPPEPADDAEDDAENVGEAQDPSLATTIGGTLCSLGAGLSCTAVVALCGTTDVITLGAVTVPCMIATVAACIGTAACLAWCAGIESVGG